MPLIQSMRRIGLLRRLLTPLKACRPKNQKSSGAKPASTGRRQDAQWECLLKNRNQKIFVHIQKGDKMSDSLEKRTVKERLIIAKSLLETVIDELPYTESKKNTIAEWKRDFKEYITFLGLLRDDYKGIIEYIDEVPITEPERKKGKWIEIKYTFHHKCSNCEWINNADSGYNFCPNCGCVMRGEEDEQ